MSSNKPEVIESNEQDDVEPKETDEVESKETGEVESKETDEVDSKGPEEVGSSVVKLPVKKDSFELNTDSTDNVQSAIQGPQWKDMTTRQKCVIVLIRILKVLALLCSLYFFICSLDLLSLGFRLVSGRSTGNFFKERSVLSNPIVGVMIGTLVTVLVQSSSTTTSILVGLVSAKIMSVQVAIPFLMGANIGTSITNAFVSLGQIQIVQEFKLAFAGACVHDCFNLLTVLVLLPIEITTNYLYRLTYVIVYSHKQDRNQTALGDNQAEFLTKLTKPLVRNIIQLDHKVLTHYAILDTKYTSKHSLIKSTIFPQESMNETSIGVVALIIAIVVLITCLLVTVKILKSMLEGKLSGIVKRTVNANIPHAQWLTGYVCILVGTFMTMMLQSSSVFTSAMTPLIGIGIITIDRAYPLTLGANVGTTITAIIASLAVEGDSFYPAFQIALCHLFFNLTGILIFYPIPFMRIPIRVAKFLGRQTAKYRWYAIAYMLLVFFVLPLMILALSFAGDAYVIAFVAICLIISVFVIVLNILQSKRPMWLPGSLRTWEWLPLGLRSLQPYDKVFRKCLCCIKEPVVVSEDDKTKDSPSVIVANDHKLEILDDNTNSKTDNNAVIPGGAVTSKDSEVKDKIQKNQNVQKRADENI